jgi:hypothetical protein
LRRVQMKNNVKINSDRAIAQARALPSTGHTPSAAVP